MCEQFQCICHSPTTSPITSDSQHTSISYASDIKDNRTNIRHYETHAISIHMVALVETNVETELLYRLTQLPIIKCPRKRHLLQLKRLLEN